MSKGKHFGKSGHRRSKVQLKEPGWTDHARSKLEKLIEQGSGQKLPVVMDLDNTILCRDIGVATFAILEKEGKLLKQIPSSLAPDFLKENEQISLANSKKLSEYYEHLLDATAHHTQDIAKEMVAYSWLVQVMEGLTPQEVVEATMKAYADGVAAQELASPEIGDRHVDSISPFFYPEIAELIGHLLDHEYEIWVISSSNVWSVRWMLIKALNDELQQRGFSQTFQPNNVVGISTLLLGSDKRMHKDDYLVRENKDYANLEPDILSKFTLTALLAPYAAGSYGKVAHIFKWIGGSPYLALGDSFGDVPMLKYAQNKLWMAKLEEPKLQEYIAPLATAHGFESRWIIQPLLHKQSPGLIPNIADLNKRKTKYSYDILRSLHILRSYRLLQF